MEVSRGDGEDFEKANLLLAKFYIDKVGRRLPYHTSWLVSYIYISINLFLFVCVFACCLCKCVE